MPTLRFVDCVDTELGNWTQRVYEFLFSHKRKIHGWLKMFSVKICEVAVRVFPLASAFPGLRVVKLP